MYTATLTNQNQISIPAGMRERSDINPGDRLVFVPDPANIDKYEVLKVKDFSQLFGVFKNKAKSFKNLARKDIWTKRNEG